MLLYTLKFSILTEYGKLIHYNIFFHIPFVDSDKINAIIVLKAVSFTGYNLIEVTIRF